MIKSVYLDTSVFGGYFDKEFSVPTEKLFNRIMKEKIVVFVSEILDAELANAPQHIRELLITIPKEQVKNIEISEEAEALAKAYISENVVGKTSYADCLHIAVATLCHADLLISWNFKHTCLRQGRL